MFLAHDDYEKFARGGGKASDILKKYLTKDEAGNLDSWDKEEVSITFDLYCVIASREGTLFNDTTSVTFMGSGSFAPLPLQRRRR